MPSFIENNQGIDADYFLVACRVTDDHLLGGLAYVAPLYLYSTEIGEKKLVNFKHEFAKMVKQKFDNPSS